MPENLPITMKDIARALGVSVATVSRALNDSPRISSVQRKRIQEYAKYGYLTFGKKVNMYQYIRLHDQRRVLPYLDSAQRQEILKRHGLEFSPTSEYRDGIVSEYEVNLKFLFRNLPGLEAYFKEHGYATTFRKARYIMTPILLSKPSKA